MVSSNSKQRQQKTSQEAFLRKNVVNTQWAVGQGPSFETAQPKGTTPNEEIVLQRGVVTKAKEGVQWCERTVEKLRFPTRLTDNISSKGHKTREISKTINGVH
ncbi:hypothetical protein [Desulfosporosinus sp.]|uniref:hypothetical protein n=1 Tax=Desulfosporosinus sp. TaxID=157907 RepID=UPI0026171C07|nr:hypothetical protein [Desulfosporosinus sp.]